MSTAASACPVNRFFDVRSADSPANSVFVTCCYSPADYSTASHHPTNRLFDNCPTDSPANSLCHKRNNLTHHIPSAVHIKWIFSSKHATTDKNENQHQIGEITMVANKVTTLAKSANKIGCYVILLAICHEQRRERERERERKTHSYSAGSTTGPVGPGSRAQDPGGPISC